MLLPLLSWEPQTAGLSLWQESQGNFADIGQAVLDQLGLSPEDHQRWFRACWMMGEDRLFGWAWKLHDTVVRWLQPGPSEGEARMLAKIVLEQFVEGLHADTLAEEYMAAAAEGPETVIQPASRQTWRQCQGGKSTCASWWSFQILPTVKLAHSSTQTVDPCSHQHIIQDDKLIPSQGTISSVGE